MRLLPVVLCALVLPWIASAQTYTISTIAGGGLPVNIPGTSASLDYGEPRYVAVDRTGNVFFEDQNMVLRWDAVTGVLTLVAGNGTTGFSGDNGPATSAQLYGPTGVALDSSGNLYIADAGNNRIRKVSTGVITTVAGNGTSGFGGDNGPAIIAQLNGPEGLAVDSAGSLYIADRLNNRIRKVAGGVITTVAGGGSSLGDNGPAVGARLSGPYGVAVDSAGNLYIADSGNNRIRKVSAGVIATVAGNGAYGFAGDNGPATSAQLAGPSGVAVDSAGNFYIADGANRIRMVTSGGITTVAGGGSSLGDNGPATSAQLAAPHAVALDPNGNLYIADSYNSRVRKVSSTVIATVAGGGSSAGDNGSPASAQLNGPYGLTVDSGGSLYIAEAYNNRIRKVSNAVITTMAGGGPSLGDNGPPTSAQLFFPEGVAVDAAANLYIADTGNNRIRGVSSGLIATVAGNGAWGFSGDGGPAPSAALNSPEGVAVDSAGNLFIADTLNHRVREVSNGAITTVAGTGTQAFGGDNGPAASAQLNNPWGVAVDSAGNLYIADTYNNRIRRVSGRVITTVAGTGTQGFGGDNGPATSAQLNKPYGIAVDAAGGLYIADSGNNRIRKVSGGVIATLAGNGTPGYSGDNGPAAGAQLSAPIGIAVDSTGNVYIADSGNTRIRLLTPTGSPCAYSVSPTTLHVPASGGTSTINIQTAAPCTWVVSGLPGWIAVSGPPLGAGPAPVPLAFSPNNSGALLNAIVLVAGVSVTVTQPATTTAPLPPIASVVNAASYIGGTVSPGEMVTIFGTAIGPATAAYPTVDPATGKLATTIGGVQVLFNGIPAPMIYASSTQVSAVVPYEMASVANPLVWINFAGQTSNAYQLTSAGAAPGLFTQNSQGSGPGAILNQDNSVNAPANAAAKGSIVQVFLTGEGQTTPQGVTGAITTVTLPPPQVTPAPVQPVAVTINGQTALYTYAGEAPGMAGLMQLNVQIPANAPSGNLSIAVSIGGNLSQHGVTVSVQ